MATLPVNTTPVVKAALSRQTQENVLEKALKFLRAVGASAPIARSLGEAGYTAADTKHGFALVEAVVGVPKVTPMDNPVAIAWAEIEQWRSTRLPIAEAALVHQHPAQAAFVFGGLDLGDPSEAVVTMSLFLGRVDQLENGKERKATHKADVAAVATLEARGFSKAERKRLGALVATIQTNTAPVSGDDATSDVQDEKLIELQAWLTEWKSIAKVVIKSRAQLIKLGIGKRRTKRAARADPAPPGAPAPVLTPAPTPIAGTSAKSGAGEEPSPNSSGPSAPQRAA